MTLDENLTPYNSFRKPATASIKKSYGPTYTCVGVSLGVSADTIGASSDTLETDGSLGRTSSRDDDVALGSSGMTSPLEDDVLLGAVTLSSSSEVTVSTIG
jgi:hypothetical protein